MLSATDKVILQRVTLRGAAAEIDDARAPLKTALEQSAWPTTAPGEFLFLRRVNAHGNPRELAARAAEQAQRLADSAVDGWSTTAPDALAVRFPSHATLIACLLRDLLQGNAQKRWYWRRWQKMVQLSTTEAIVTLLSEAPLELPAVVEQLRATPVWKLFWQQLGSTGAAELLAIAGQISGWSSTIQTAHVISSTTGGTTTAITSHIVPLFDLTFLSCAKNDSRPLLAALLTLWQQAPTLLNQECGALQLRHLAQTIVGELTDTTEPQHSLERLSHERSEWFGYEAQRKSGDTSPYPTESHGDRQAQIPAHPPFSKGRTEGTSFSPEGEHQLQTEPRTSSSFLKGSEEGFNPPTKTFPTLETIISDFESLHTSLGEEQETQTTKTISIDSFEHNFITQQGGLFYLLNFLNLPSVRTQLRTDLPGAGWRWFYDLATALECVPEGGTLEFIAQECGFENGVVLARQPVTTPSEQLLRLGVGRYGEEVWNAGTWRIPARLIATPSHLDLHFRLNDANPAVRRVGLDINPGWLPWLGRVVTFHYGNGLEPGK